MTKKRPVTNQDIEKAKEFLRRFGDVNLPRLDRSGYEDMIGFYYNRIRGVPLRNIRDDQLYRIAQRLYNQAFEIVEKDRKTGLDSIVSS